ncbi:MAG: hypothetical protein WCC64_01350 [Aliidongia sp.]
MNDAANRLYGTVVVDPARVGRDAGLIADKVISRSGKGQQCPFPCRILGERRNLFSVRVSEGNTLLNLIERVRDQFPCRIRMAAFVLRDTTQMSLSALQFFERTLHVRLGGKCNACAEAHCGSNDGDREHLVGVLAKNAHESFL